MANEANPNAYGSINDLPSVVALREQIRGLGQLIDSDRGRLQIVGKDRQQMRRELRDLKRQIDQMERTVEKFYAGLGPRNWIFTGDLNFLEMEKITALSSAETMEKALIDYYNSTNRLNFPLLRILRLEKMRPREDLIRLAHDDYKAERYYSTVQTLLGVMDGFVADVDEKNRGIHAKSEDEMAAWDKVSGHHMGLQHALRTFHVGAYKTSNDPEYELKRNAIVHGRSTNFNNVVVATKAWNHLFAIADWAESVSKKENLTPQPDPPKAYEMVAYTENLNARNHRLESWKPREYNYGDTQWKHSRLARTLEAFLVDWSATRWALVGKVFYSVETTTEQIEQAKKFYAGYPLETWNVLTVRHDVPVKAIAEVRMTIGGVDYLATLMWMRVAEDNSAVPEWEEGSWKLVHHLPGSFLAQSPGLDS